MFQGGVRADALVRAGICTATRSRGTIEGTFPRGNTRPAATGLGRELLKYKSMNPVQSSTSDAAKLLTVREVASLLRQSTTTVYRLVARRAIRFLRFPNGLRFRRVDLDAYLASLVVETVDYDLV